MSTYPLIPGTEPLLEYCQMFFLPEYVHDVLYCAIHTLHELGTELASINVFIQFLLQ